MGLIGIDYNVLYKEADRLGIELSNRNMKKIQSLENFYRAEYNDRSKNKKS